MIPKIKLTILFAAMSARSLSFSLIKILKNILIWKKNPKARPMYVVGLVGTIVVSLAICICSLTTNFGKMADNTKIQWGQNSVNFWWGCERVSSECDNCYAADLSKSFKGGTDIWGNQPRQFIRSAKSKLLKWQSEAEKLNDITIVFANSMSDLMEKSKSFYNLPNKTTGDVREEFFQDITNGRYNNLVFLILTKRPSNITKMIPESWLLKMPKNVWFGTSVGSEASLRKVDMLRGVPSNNLFLSIEPQIEAINNIDLSGIGWVIQGGENYKYGNPRPFDIEWAYRMREMCKEQGVPYFMKQIDEKTPVPQDLLTREFPKFKKGNMIDEFNGIVPLESRDTVKLTSYNFYGYRSKNQCLLQEKDINDSFISDRKRQIELNVEGSDMDSFWMQDERHFYSLAANTKNGCYKPLVRILCNYDENQNTMHFSSFLKEYHVVEFTMSEAIAIARKCKQALQCGNDTTRVNFLESDFRIVSDYNPPKYVISA